MTPGRMIRLFLRSGSMRFAANSRASAFGRSDAALRWGGREIFYRPGTSDTENILKILLRGGEEGEYWLPGDFSPRTVLDIGANIGLTTLYFKRRYPEARVHCFEPYPDNYRLLRRNIEGIDRVEAHPVALGDRNGKVSLHFSDNPRNFGGFSIHEAGSDAGRSLEVEVRNSREFLEGLGVGAVDLIKIDTEGAEFEIIQGMGDNLVRSAKWIVGELHGRRDFELLAHLSQWFEVGIDKRLGKRLSMFRARNRLLGSRTASI